MSKSDYKKGLDSVKNIQKIYLGQEVETSFGKGIVVRMEMDFNGLYIRPECSKVVVWFSCTDSKGGWVSHSFKLSEVKANYRKEKLEKLNELCKS